MSHDGDILKDRFFCLYKEYEVIFIIKTVYTLTTCWRSL